MAPASELRCVKWVLGFLNALSVDQTTCRSYRIGIDFSYLLLLSLRSLSVNYALSCSLCGQFLHFLLVQCEASVETLISWILLCVSLRSISALRVWHNIFLYIFFWLIPQKHKTRCELIWKLWILRFHLFRILAIDIVISPLTTSSFECWGVAKSTLLIYWGQSSGTSVGFLAFETRCLTSELSSWLWVRERTDVGLLSPGILLASWETFIVVFFSFYGTICGSSSTKGTGSTSGPSLSIEISNSACSVSIFLSELF